MSRRAKKLLLGAGLFWALIICLVSAAYSDSETFNARALVNQPTSVYLKLVFWKNRTAPVNTIDFSLGASGVAIPARTSWADSDSWTSLADNVGFNVIAIGPEGSLLNIKCGKMKRAAGIEEIPYKSADGQTDYFGFSAISVPDGAYLAGSANSMQVHSLGGWSFVFPPQVFGKELAVYNVLKIPSYTIPGEYATTGSGSNSHLVVTLM